MLPERETTDPDPIVVEDHNRPVSQLGLERGEVGPDQRDDVCRSSAALTTEEDHRWPGGVRAGEQLTEVGVCRQHDSIVSAGDVEQLVIECSRQTELHDVDCVVPGVAEQARDDRGLVLVDEEPHAGWRRGSSRSRTAAAA